MRQDTLFIGMSAFKGNMGKGKMDKGRGLPRVLTVVKTAPLGTSFRR